MQTEKVAMTEAEVNELRKSLTDLNLTAEEIDAYISKAQRVEKDEGGAGQGSGTEPTIAEQAAGGSNKEGEKSNKGSEAAPPAKEKDEGAAEEDDAAKRAKLVAQKNDIEKAIADLDTKMGKTAEEPIEKSIDIDIEKSISAHFNEIRDSIEERFADIQKSLGDRFNGDLESLRATIGEIQSEVKKIGDTPLGMKSILTGGANFFEKGMRDDLAPEEKSLSISHDKDDIIKGMQDLLAEETDSTARQILEDGIVDITVNAKPTNNGVRALSLLSRKKNITLQQ